MKKLALVLTLLIVPVSSAYSNPGELFPPNARPGECYTRVFQPPQYKTSTERVLVSEPGERVSVTPAKYEWGTEKVLVSEPGYKLEVIPATYKTVKEEILVKPASSRLESVPPQFETVTERVLDKPAHTAWKKGSGGAGAVNKMNDSTGEIMCLVEVPATYKTITKRVLKSPASTKEVQIPAQYKTITKRVLDRPATTRQIEIPAKFSTVKVQKLVSPPTQQRTEIPAKYDTVTRTEKVSEGQMAWAQILCETNATPNMVRPIQQALKAKGYNVGVDGNLGSQTLSAVKSFQKKNQLAVGGLTFETIRALGVAN